MNRVLLKDSVLNGAGVEIHRAIMYLIDLNQEIPGASPGTPAAPSPLPLYGDPTGVGGRRTASSYKYSKGGAGAETDRVYVLGLLLYRGVYHPIFLVGNSLGLQFHQRGGAVPYRGC